MFKHLSNTMCNNGLFIYDKIAVMEKQIHETVVRLYHAAKTVADIEGQSAIALRLNTSPQTVKNWETRGMSQEGMIKAQEVFGCSAAWLKTGKGDMILGGIATARPYTSDLMYSVKSADETGESTYKIVYLEVKGSCGGGTLNWENEVKGTLIKEASWFRKYNLKPDNGVVIYADGDSMSDFIVDGDMVIFDRSKTTPKSGKIFLIDHPDGLRIKQLRREIDGTWILESRNQDKRKFPDERISASQEELLRVVGEFVYRQGG